MSNLSGKFNALQTFLTALFEPVITQLDAINTKLTALAALANNVNTLVNVGSFQLTTLNGINTTATAISNRLATIENILTFSLTQLNGINTRDALRYTLEQQVATAIGASSGSGLAPLTETQRNIADLLAILNASLGSPTSTTAGTAIALLRNLPDILDCVCMGPGPDLGAVDGCIDPFVSSGSVVGEPAEGELAPPIYATFPGTLPANISFGSADLLAPFQAELVVNYTSDWRYYVESSAPSHRTSRNSMSLKPNNQWTTLVGTLTNIAWLVDQPYTLKVYICSPDGGVPTECEQFDLLDTIGTNQAYTISGYPGDFTFGVSENYNVYETNGTFRSGPFNGGVVAQIADRGAQPMVIASGAIGGTQVFLTICPPAA